MSSYQHSRSFDVLKRTDEKFKNNYTTAQLLNTLDHFIWQALTPIIRECPDLFLTYVTKIVAQQANSNSKLTSDDKLLFPALIINLLSAPTFEQRMAYARKLYLNRGLLFGLIAIFTGLTRSYRRAVERGAQDNPLQATLRSTRLYQIEQKVGLRKGGNLYGAILEASHWAAKAYQFKHIITEKYTRLAAQHARNTYVEYGHDVELDECLSIYMMTVDKAINRCDSRHGVLTTFITNWFKGARAKIEALALTRRSETSYEVMLEKAGDAASSVLGAADADSEMTEHVQHLSVVARYVDKRGCVRASLGIPEVVNRQQRLKLLLFAID